MEKKQKMKLNNLKVSSFITQVNQQDSVKGGIWDSMGCNTQNQCNGNSNRQGCHTYQCHTYNCHTIADCNYYTDDCQSGFNSPCGSFVPGCDNGTGPRLESHVNRAC